MRVLVLYYSKGGNTRKLAEAIAEGVGQIDGAEAVLRHTRDVSKDDFVSAASKAPTRRMRAHPRQCRPNRAVRPDNRHQCRP